MQNKKLLGTIEWIVSQDGTVEIFNSHVVMGHVHRLHYRYFISEGWIGLKTPTCPPGKSLCYSSLKSFIKSVETYKDKT